MSKKFLIGILGILIVGFIVQSFFAWWTIAIVAALFGAILNISTYRSYLLGFFGIFLLWGAYALFINTANDGILATRMGALLGGLSPILLILTTSILGGLIGGFAALTGKLGRELIRSN